MEDSNQAEQPNDINILDQENEQDEASTNITNPEIDSSSPNNLPVNETNQEVKPNDIAENSEITEEGAPNQEKTEEDQKLHHIQMEYCPHCGVPIMYCRFFGHIRQAPKTETDDNENENDEADQRQEEEDPNQAKKKKKEATKPNILVTIRRRTGRKYITTISNIEAWGIDSKEFSKSVSKRMAIGCSYNMSQFGLQIVVQGDVEQAMIGDLVNIYHIPKDKITSERKIKKKRVRFIPDQPQYELPVADDTGKVPMLWSDSDESDSEESENEDKQPTNIQNTASLTEKYPNFDYEAALEGFDEFLDMNPVGESDGEEDKIDVEGKEKPAEEKKEQQMRKQKNQGDKVQNNPNQSNNRGKGGNNDRSASNNNRGGNNNNRGGNNNRGANNNRCGNNNRGGRGKGKPGTNRGISKGSRGRR